MLAAMASPVLWALPRPPRSAAAPAASSPARWLRPLAGLTLLAAIGAGGPGCPRHTPGTTVRGGTLAPLEIAHSPEPRAEAAYRDAERARTDGKTADATRRFRAFTSDYPSDPLVPYAKLELGRIELDGGNPAAAQRWFSGLGDAPDPALAERARMYRAIADGRLGRSQEALPVLRALVGRTVEPSETAALLDALSRAEAASGNTLAALEARDQLLRGELSSAQRSEAERAAGELIDRLDPQSTLARAYELLPHDGFAWPRVAERALRDANAQGQRERVATIADDLHGAGVALSPELAAMVLRASRSADADPEVIGAILPLSGRGREAGEAALHGLLLAAERASRAASGSRSGAPRVVYRDDGGDPAKAVQALDDLVTNHRAIAVVGPLSAAPARAVAARSKSSSVPLVVLVADRSLNEQAANVFRILPSPAEEAQLLVARALADGAKRFAIMHSQTPYGEALREAFESELKRRGAPTQVVSYAPGATNLLKEAEAVAKTSPDAVILADSAAKLALLAPALSVHGLWSVARGAKPPEGRAALFLVPSIGFDAGLVQSSRRYLQGALFAVPFDAGRAASFRDAYRAEFQSEPNLFSASAFDAYQILRSALAKGAVSRAELGEALRGSRAGDVAGASDGFTESRGPRHGAMLETLLGDAFVRVD
jgi:branched-chain amino acid transport system substrate-binding protein